MTDRPNRPFAPATRVAQALHRVEADGAVVPDITLASTFARDNDYAPRAAYIYGRDGGPTVRHAEAILTDLDGAARSLLFASGMAAFVCLLESLPPAAHVIAPRVMYHGGQTWLHRLADRGRLEVTFIDQAEPGALEAALRPGTALVWIETPANPSWDIVDIAAAARAAHDAGARLAVDATAAPPTAMQALALGADIVFQSATKYLNGHSDLTAGVLSINDSGLSDDLYAIRTLMGSTLAGFEAWLLIRGLRTLFLRWERASASALAVARALSGHPKVDRVLYPGLPDHPGHAIASAQMGGQFGGMLSLLVTGDGAIARDVARATRLFHPATSLGGVESLIEHRKAVEGPHSIVPAQLLRLSVGIEDAEDLIADLEQAFARAS